MAKRQRHAAQESSPSATGQNKGVRWAPTYRRTDTPYPRSGLEPSEQARSGRVVGCFSVEQVHQKGAAIERGFATGRRAEEQPAAFCMSNPGRASSPSDFSELAPVLFSSHSTNKLGYQRYGYVWDRSARTLR